MKEFFIVYECGRTLSLTDSDLVGVFTSKRMAINTIVKKHRIRLSEFFDPEDMRGVSRRVLKAEARRILRRQLEDISQTQGYETNYHIEAVWANTWLRLT